MYMYYVAIIDVKDLVAIYVAAVQQYFPHEHSQVLPRLATSSQNMPSILAQSSPEMRMKLVTLLIHIKHELINTV